MESTSPWDWLTSWFGIPSDANVEETTLNGTTGSNGALVFTMVESIKYQIDIYAPATARREAITTTVFLYPLESEHVITLIPDKELSSDDAIDADLWTEVIDADTIRVGLTYNDTTSNTTLLTFNVYNTTMAEDGTVDYDTLYSTTESNPAEEVELYYDFDYMGGETLVWGYDVNHAIYGNDITDYDFITIESNRPMIDIAPWIPMWVYNWSAIFLLFAITAVFSYLSLKFGAVVVPIMGGLLKYWGFLATSWTIVSVCIALGILIYMRISESESDT